MVSYTQNIVFYSHVEKQEAVYRNVKKHKTLKFIGQ